MTFVDMPFDMSIIMIFYFESVDMRLRPVDSLLPALYYSFESSGRELSICTTLLGWVKARFWPRALTLWRFAVKARFDVKAPNEKLKKN